MLLGGKQANIKPVAVVTRNRQFTRLLSSLLADWKFSVVEDLSAANVIFAEYGVKLPEHGGQVIWLTPMPLSEGSSLEIPISLSRLYCLLETHLFLNPRRHIRVAMETEVDLRIDGQWFDGYLLSLSGRGGRIASTHEIPRGKMLDIAVKLAGRVLRIPAEVLYSIPAGDSTGRLQPQAGVIFKPSQGYELDLLQRFVEKTSVERACAREDILLTDPCVSWLDVPVDPWDMTAS